MKYELTHDSLAVKIEEMVSDEQKIRRKIQRFLNDQFEQYQDRKVLLDSDDLDYIRPHLSSLPLDQSITQFISKSESALKQKQRVGLSVIAIILIVISASGIEAWISGQKFKAQYYNAKARQVLKEDPTVALRMTSEALLIDDNEAIKKDLFKTYYGHIFYKTILRLNQPILDAVRDDEGNITTLTVNQTEPEVWGPDGEPKGKLIGHVHPVLDIDISKNGLRVTAGNDKRAILWDQDGNQIQIFKPENLDSAPDIRDVDISKNGNWILTGASNGNISLWQTGKEKAIYSVSIDREILDISLNDSCNLIFVAARDSKPIYFSKKEGKWSQKILENFRGEASSIKLSPDGKFVIIGRNDGGITIWEFKNNKFQLGPFLLIHHFPVLSQIVSNQTNIIGSASADSSAIIMNNDLRNHYNLIGHHGEVNSINIDNDNFIMTSSLDSTIRLWKYPTAILDKKLGVHLRGAKVTSIADDGLLVASGGQRGKVILNNLKIDSTQWEHHLHKDPIIAINFGLESTLNSIDEYGKVISYQIDDQHINLEFQAGEEELLSADFSEDGKWLLTGGYDSTAKLWDVEAQKLLAEFPHKGSVFSVAISKDKSQLITGSEDSLVYLWNPNGELLRVFTGHQGGVYSVGFTPKTQKIVSGGEDQRVIIWKENGEISRQFKGIPLPINSFSINSEESLITVAYAGHETALFDMEGEMIDNFSDGNAIINQVYFTPDDQNIFTVADDGYLRIWKNIKLPLKDFLQSQYIQPLDQKMKVKYQIE